jgi:hypothetical protein
MVNDAARGHSLAFIVTACTCRLVKNEIHLQFRMPLAKNVDEPSLNASSTKAPEGMQDSNGAGWGHYTTNPKPV